MTDALLRDRVIAAIGDRYDIIRELGRGALSVVYAGRDVRLDRPVAVKVLPPDAAFRPEVRARFLREAQMAARLAHPNIVPIYAVDDEAGIVSIVMAQVEGESLKSALATRPQPSVVTVLRLLRDVSDALGFAHAQGVVHRDVKPDNILIERATGRALVTDFGIARAMEGGDQVTVTGVAVGTPAYMSPEQAMGERAVDGRTDVYALGVVAYEMLAGELPFKATNTPSMLMKHVGEPVPSLAAKRPDLPPALVALVERALAKKPEQRFADGRALRVALDAVGDGHAVAGRVTPVPVRPVAAAAAVEVASAVAQDRGAPLGAVLPPEAPFPQFPVHGDATARDEWRRATKAWRQAMQAQGAAVVRAEAQGRAALAPASPEDEDPALTMSRRLRKFRRSVWNWGLWSFALIGFNAMTVPFPWSVFPVYIGLQKLRREADEIRDLGGRPWAAVFGRGDAQVATIPREIAEGGEAAVELRVERFRRAATMTGIGASSAAALAGLSAATGAEPLAAFFGISVIVTMMTAVTTARRALDVRALGIRLRDAWRGTWRAAIGRENPVLAGQLAESAAKKLLPSDVAQGPYADVVRQATADRVAILETIARLSPTDRGLLPDVLPTVQHLEGRILTLATSLHRMSGDVTPAQQASVEERIAAAYAQPESAERDRTIALLTRQRESLAELAGRRTTMQSQLESAALLLTTLKLDLLRLRSVGIETALPDVTSATQEARALSRDIGVALGVAEEMRKL
ncbi:MAG: serine/threonine-protein kinase [Gemmatimonadaceae bacterium]|nr:serine/threonine-protein kinase [Gemmatimonadaceae bacterium]